MNSGIIVVCFSAGATSQAVDTDGAVSRELQGLNAVLLELQSIQSSLSAELPVCYVVHCRRASRYVDG